MQDTYARSLRWAQTSISKKDNGEFALLDAAGYEHLEAAEALLANGANPNAIARGLTPLTQAESVEMINLLFKYGADPNIPDGDGDLPIVTRITNRDKRGTIVLRDAVARIQATATGAANLPTTSAKGTSSANWRTFRTNSATGRRRSDELQS